MIPRSSCFPVNPGPGREHHEEAHHEEFHQDEAHHSEEQHARTMKRSATEGNISVEHHDAVQSAPTEDRHAEAREERQPIPTLPRPRTSRRITTPRKTIPPAAVTTAPARFGRGTDRGGDRGGDRVAIAAEVPLGTPWRTQSRWTPAGRPGAGANLPPSKYASPQSGESRGYDIAADSRAVTTIAVRKRRAVRPFCDQCHEERSFFRVNRWQSIAASL